MIDRVLTGKPRPLCVSPHSLLFCSDRYALEDSDNS